MFFFRLQLLLQDQTSPAQEDLNVHRLSLRVQNPSNDDFYGDFSTQTSKRLHPLPPDCCGEADLTGSIPPFKVEFDRTRDTWRLTRIVISIEQDAIL